jgi:hypothetical protein
MLRGCLFFLNEFMNQPWHRAAAETPRWLKLCFPFRITHVSFVKGLLGSDVIVVIKSQFAAFTALQVLRHKVSLPISLPAVESEVVEPAIYERHGSSFPPRSVEVTVDAGRILTNLAKVNQAFGAA